MSRTAGYSVHGLMQLSLIQAVADGLNLTIHIIESNPGFVLVTNISAVSSETDTALLYNYWTS